MGNDRFEVIGSNTSQLTITAIGPQRLFTPSSDFVEILKTVQFTTNDQTGLVEHALSLVVQEFPLETSVPSQPGLINVVVQSINDRPMIISTQRSDHILTGYIPESTNLGFLPSFLLNETNIVDIDNVDPPFVGLAIIGFTDYGRGSWMVWEQGVWVSLPSDISDCRPQLVAPSTRIRFVPYPNTTKTASRASLVYRAWDGTSLIDCEGDFSAESAVSAENETFTYYIEYLNRAPVIIEDGFTLPYTDEDTTSEAVLIANIVDDVANDDDDEILGLAVIDADSSNGVWQYETMGLWINFPNSLNPHSLLLLSDENQIRFIPHANFFGNASFYAVAWDMTDNDTSTDPYTFSTNYTTISIFIVAVNDPPVAELGMSGVAYTEGGPSIQIFRNLTIFDIDDSELEWAEVVLECPMCSENEGSGGWSGSAFSLFPNTSDTIVIRHGPPNFVPTVDYTGSVLRIDSDASIDDFVRYLESLHFVSSSREPSMAPRVVSLQVSDGMNVSNSVSVNISIVLVNDEPPSLTLPYSSIAWIEDSGDLRLFSYISISDPDDSTSLIKRATLQLEYYDPAFESLFVNCSQFGLNCTYSDGVLTLQNEQTRDVYEQALEEVYYVNTAPEPEDHLREVLISVFDGRFTSQAVQLIIYVELINDQLPIVMIDQSEVIFQEPLTNPITTSIRIAPNLTIADPDSGNFLLHSASVMISDPLDGSSEGLRLSSGENPLINISGEYGHTLTIYHEGGIHPMVLQDTIREVEYFNSAEQQTPTNRTIQIVVLDDLLQGGPQETIPVNITIVHRIRDDPPEVRLVSNILMYTEHQNPRKLSVAVGANITDVDSTSISGLEIILTANDSVDVSGDRIDVTLTGYEEVISNETPEDPTRIVLSGVAGLSAYTAVLRRLTYYHEGTIGDLDTGVRHVTITPFSSTNISGVSDVVMIGFTSVNHPPIVDLNGPTPGFDNTVFFIEDSSQPLPLVDSQVNITDVDSQTLTFMAIELLNRPDGDLESISLNNNSSLLVQLEPGRLIQVIGQATPIDEFEAILSTLVYHNLADEPDSATRTVHVETNDGESSDFSNIVIHIVPQNDRPVVALNQSEVVYVEGEEVAIASDAQVVDPDNLIIGYRVRPEQIFSGDVVSGPYLSFNQTINVYLATLSAMTPPAAGGILQQLMFTSSAPEPSPLPRVFCISVQDSEMAMSLEACLTLRVETINDNTPVFGQPSYEVMVPENVPNTVIVEVMAVDVDSINSQVVLTYSISRGDDCTDSSVDSSGSGDGMRLLPEQPCRFEINPQTGQVNTTSSPPDREVRDTYTLTISVTDGELSNETQLTVIVLDVNDNAPMFMPENYEVQIPVNAMEGYLVVQLTVVDPDLNSGFSLIMLPTDSNIGRDAFTFLPDIPGAVVLNRPERELGSDNQYTLVFEALDSTSPFSMSTNLATVVINVTQNQRPPVFDMESYEGTVPEDASEGTSILTVSVTDSDSSYHGEFTLFISDPNIPFDINPQTGVLYVEISDLIDFEATQEYVFSVVARDSGRPQMSSSATVRVGITNVNDNFPTFEQSAYTVEVCESAPVGHEFLQVLAEDGDGDALMYSIVTMSGCLECITVNRSTGSLSIAESLNYESASVVTFSVTVTDGLTFSDVPISLNILNDNEEGPVFRFDSEIIEIPETWEIERNLPLPPQYIPLADDIDSCNIDQCDGTTIINSEACTGRSGLTYSITSGNEELFFEIDPELGLVSVSQDLDADTSSHQVFNLTLTVSDRMFNDTAVLVVIVTDINDNLPRFVNTTYSVAVREDTSVGTTIITTLAIDLDSTDTLVYSIIDDSGHFNITTNGEVYVVEALDFESISLYTVIVTVTDRSYSVNGTVEPASLNIQIIDVNDNSPVFLSFGPFTIPENSPPSSIGFVEATDIDPVNVSITYYILSDNNDSFVIDSITGEISSTRLLDREVQDIYAIVVQARDNGVPPLSTNVIVFITVEDLNESPPRFADDVPSTVVVSEDAAVGSVVVTLVASDVDGNNIGFRIVGGANETFSLQPSSGPQEDGSGSDLLEDSLHYIDIVLMLATLDYEIINGYSLVVEVFDVPDTAGGISLSSVVTIEIQVTDENDNPPLFTAAVYTVEIEELTDSGTPVAQVSATDADSGSNAVISYEIVVDSELFSIDSETGIVTVVRSELLAIDVVGLQYALEVTASNPEPPFLSSSATVLVQLLDINDNAPFFLTDEIIISVPEDFTPNGNEMIPSSTSGSGIGITNRFISNITAVDRDQGINAALRYSLITGSDSFYIDPVSGELYVTIELDREVQDSYEMEVGVTDMGLPPLVNSTSVTVMVIDVNDNTPMFLEDSYSGRVAENQPTLINVIQLSATDLDIGENAEIAFSIIGEDSSLPFIIDHQSMYLLTTESLDIETRETYSFTVEARTGDLASVTEVTVTVEDVNEFPPAISPSGPVNISLAENTPNGTLVQIFTITDEDVGAGAESNITLRPSTNLFSIDNTGRLLVAGHIDYELLQSLMLTVVARNLAPPHFETLTDVLISIENKNDNPPIVGFGASSVTYDELIQRRVILNVDISISDADGRDVTRLVDGIVKFENEDIEPSFAYEPVIGGDIVPEFGCTLEVNKQLKFRSCEIPEVNILSRYTDGVLQLLGGLEEGVNVVQDSIVFDASLQQYAQYIDNVGTLDTQGLTLSTWIWYEPSTSSEPQAILTKYSSSQTLYGVFCYPDGSLVFNFTSEGSEEQVVFSDGCTTLQGAWHHLGLVVDNTNTSQWVLNIFIDGAVVGSVEIPQPFDSIGGYLLGASRDQDTRLIGNFFNGRVHMLAISLSSTSLNHINCVIGCGLTVISLQDTPLPHYYDYSRRALIIESLEPISEYEEFLDSLALVLPFTEPRISQYVLSYTVQDEVFNCLPTSIDIIVIASNDFQPELSLNGTVSRDYSTVFVEENGPVALVNTATFYLTDMDLIEFEYVVTVRIVDPLQPFTEEVLSVQNVPSGMNVSYTSDHTLTLTGLLPLPMFEAVTRTLTYDNMADEPLGGSREILVIVSDPPLPDISARSTVEFIFLNDPPQLFVISRTTEYSEGEAAMLLLQSVVIEDSDSPIISSAIITFSVLDPGMEFLTTNTSGTDITAEFDETSGTLTLSGPDTQERYRQVLTDIVYEHTGMADPTLGTRLFTFVISDEESESDPVTVSLFFAAVNDAPVLSLTGFSGLSNFSISFVEDTDDTVSIVSPNATIVDLDNDRLTFLNLTLLEPEEYESISVSVDDVSTIESIVIDSTFITLVPVSGYSGAPLSDFINVLRTATYTNTAEEPVPSPHTIEFIASDGESLSLPVFTVVNIVSTNDRPMLDLDTESPGTGYVTSPFVERGDPVYITGRSISLIDNDESDSVEFIEIVIVGAADGLDEIIVSSDPNIDLPIPTNGQSVRYLVTPDSLNTTDPIIFITSLQYRNSRLEPTPGDRTLTIAISDGRDFSNTAVVSLTVEGVNENSPQFTMNTYSFSTQEGLSPPALIGNVRAIDIDDGRDGTVSYGIESSSPVEGLTHFMINTTSGDITAVEELDREDIEMYELTVVASDGGLPQQTTNALVYIVVGDINDNAPVFYPDEDKMVVMVPETTSLGEVIETVALIDPDSGGAGISLEITNQSTPFDILVSFIHEIRVAGDLDVDSQTPEGCINEGMIYDLHLLATESVPPYALSTDVLTIHVTDVNDNPPSFLSESYFSVFEENSNPVLFTVIANDLDCTTNGEITYSFQNSSTYDLFNISSSTGVVTSLLPLDRESQHVHFITVVASDGGSPRLTVTMDITLEVLDVNDNAPVFSEALYQYDVSEGDEVNNLGGIEAIDSDSGLNAEVAEYYLDSTTVPINPFNDQPFFTIESSTGIITFNTTGTLEEFEFESSYRLIVFAADSGLPSLTSSTEVLVYVSDINDNAPVVSTSSSHGEILENQVGYLIATFTATDIDSGTNSEVTFSLDNTYDVFSIHSTTGNLTTVEPLDFENVCYYSLSVLATDRGQEPLTSLPYFFEVFVQPEEDVAPQFESSLFTASVPENSPAGTLVTQIVAEDGDLRDCMLDLMSGSGSGSDPGLYSLSYYFNESYENFIIDELTGEISLLRALDYEEARQYELSVEVLDVAGLQAETIVLVNVLDRNDVIPQFLQTVYETTIRENTAIGSSVLQVVAIDEDTLDQGRLVYSLINASPYFDIDASTGIIVVSGPIDFETVGDALSLSVRVADSAGNMATVDVAITVEDSNDIPPVINTQSGPLLFVEGQVSLRLFTGIDISDSDSFQYLCNATLILYSPEKDTTYEPDECYCSNSTVDSTCSPDCPEFLQLPSGLFPGVVQQRQGGYELLMTGNHSIDEYEAALETVEYVNVIFDPQPLPRTVELSVCDCLLPSNTITLSIDIQPLNLNAPIVDLNGDAPGINYQITFIERGNPVAIVSENLTVSDSDVTGMEPLLTGLLVILTNAPDEYESIFFTTYPIGISVYSNSTYISLTGTNNLEVYTDFLKSLRYRNLAAEPSPESRMVEITAYQHSQSSQTVITEITIETINDYPPSVIADPPRVNYITQFEEESNGVGIVAPTAQIVDRDSTNDDVIEMEVYIIHPAPTERLNLTATPPPEISVEQIAPHNLAFSGTATKSSYEALLRSIHYQNTEEEFTDISQPAVVFIQIADHSLSGFTVVQIELAPVNDNLPQFTESDITFSVAENTTVGTSLYTVLYSDQDTFSTTEPSFSILGGNDFFSIIPDTGVITLAQSLDHETTQELSFVVAVDDLGYVGSPFHPATVEVTVLVTDQNDHTPMFTRDFYNATIDEGAPIGTSVIQFSATDRDSPIHSVLEYNVINTTAFDVDTTGTLVTITELDQEIQSFHQFVVSVRNPGDIVADTAGVFITISDINDHPPLIILSPSNATLQEPQPYTSLSTHLSIMDSDTSPSLDYAIIEISGEGPGVLIATYSLPEISVSGNGTKSLIFIGDRQSLASYEEVLRGVVYEDDSTEPMDITRYIAYQVGSDPGSVVAINYTGGSLTRSNVAIMEVNVELINDQIPEIVLDSRTTPDLVLPDCSETGSYSTTYQEDANPVTLSHSSLQITDLDSGGNLILWATVELLDPEEEESINYAGPLEVNTTSPTSLMIHGPATITEFETALRSVTYETTSQNPRGIRQIVFSINDGMFTSEPALACVQLSPVNDPPVVTLGPDGSVDTTVMYTEGQTDTLEIAPQLSITGKNISSLTLYINFILFQNLLLCRCRLSLPIISSSGNRRSTG